MTAWRQFLAVAKPYWQGDQRKRAWSLIALLVALMLVGRLGPITFATALALRSRPRRYELPMERPMIG